ncbi:MAG: hypothetical protein R8M45_00800 [Ghiorsea sp.]
MLIEISGKKFYAPDSASSLDAAGAWQGVGATDLIPWDVHQTQLHAAELHAELAALEAEATDAACVVYARAEWRVCQRIDAIKAELAI